MTSRLKRKLNDLGVDTSTSKANESFCLIGTPLPPLEKSKDTGEFVPLWKQDVRDEKGRRRLHGAFTGGFSAGYFNTVGSKEGWAPSTFKSSRADRAKQKAARPEDFMDEEDLAELRDSQTLVLQNDEVDIAGRYAGDLASRSLDADNEQNSMSLALEKALLPAPKDSPAARILAKMGWRHGQGIGLRLTWRQKKLQDAQAKSARILTLDDLKLSPSEEDEEAQKHTYPRADTPLTVVPRKDNAHGLGYTPGLSLNDALGDGRDPQSSGPRISGGFGLGALNDADEDDIDIYDSGPSSRRNLTAYETGDEGRYHHLIDRKSVPGPQMNASRSKNTPLQRFRNGEPVLAEFALAGAPVTDDKWYPLEEVPPGWKPDPHRVWDKYNKNEPTAPIPTPGNKGNLTIDQRGQALGETPLPSKPRSIFDYMSQKDRERLKNFIPPETRSGGPTPITSSLLPPEQPPASRQFVYPRIEPSVAKAALVGFKPFTSDPVKQARYTAYLKSQSEVVGDEDRLQLKQKPGQDLDNFQAELEEYAQAATVFKPLSGAMAGRFTTAKTVEHGPAVIEGLHTPSRSTPPPEAKGPEAKVEEPENAKTHAVKHGMYGILTRETSVWVPARLLCKRFGVKEPETGAREEDLAMSSKARNEWESEAVFAEVELTAVSSGGDVSSSAAASQSVDGDDRRKRRDLNNIGLGEDDTQGADILTYQKPERSIFKAIFASDEEDSGDEDQVEVEDTDLRDTSIPAPSGTPVQHSKEDAQMDVDDSPVDLATFKPKFVPRAERTTDDNPPSKKRKKDREKRKGGKALVSFDVEEDGEDIPVTSKTKDKDKDRERRKKRRSKDKDSEKDRDRRERRKEAGGNEDDVWVEKAVPEVVQKMSVDPPPEPPKEKTEKGRLSKRMRAEDFM